MPRFIILRLFQDPFDPFIAIKSQQNLFILGSYGCNLVDGFNSSYLLMHINTNDPVVILYPLGMTVWKPHWTYLMTFQGLICVSSCKQSWTVSLQLHISPLNPFYLQLCQPESMSVLFSALFCFQSSDRCQSEVTLRYAACGPKKKGCLVFPWHLTRSSRRPIRAQRQLPPLW